MALELVVRRLRVLGFRNLSSVEFVPARRVNVISGKNGQGKTSLLEALYFLATSKSFRTEKASELRQNGTEDANVMAEISEDGIVRVQKAALGARRRSFITDETRAKRLSDYAVQTPAVVFHPGDLLLTQGPAAGRRTLLDRVALYVDPPSLDHRLRYQRAQRERLRLLEDVGLSGPELDAFEQVMARHGARVAAAHRLAAERLIEALGPAFGKLADPEISFEARFEPGGPEDEHDLARTLAENRAADRARKRSGVGPHRDDLGFFLDGRAARQHASQGQHRILTLSIKLAELACVREARGVHPLLLLDDVSSELDPSRTGSVYEFLREVPSQVFVTTTRADLFQTAPSDASERADFEVSGGELQRLDTPR